MQDFAPFTPELLGALSGPQTPGRKATSLREADSGRHAARIYGLKNFSFFLCGLKSGLEHTQVDQTIQQDEYDQAKMFDLFQTFSDLR